MSNDYLAARFQLADPRVDALLDIGWDEPDDSAQSEQGTRGALPALSRENGA